MSGIGKVQDCGTKGRMDTNDSLRVASLWHSMHAISQQLSPVNGCSGIELLQADTFDLHCFQSLPGLYTFSQLPSFYVYSFSWLLILDFSLRNKVLCGVWTWNSSHGEPPQIHLWTLHRLRLEESFLWDWDAYSLRAFRHQPFSSCSVWPRCTLRTISSRLIDCLLISHLTSLPFPFLFPLVF